MISGRARPRFALAAGLLIAACGAPPKPIRGAEAAGAVTGAVREARPSAESAMYASLIIDFHNTTARAVEVTRFELAWSAGKHLGAGPRLQAGESREWRVRILPSEGDLDALLADPAGASITVLEVR